MSLEEYADVTKVLPHPYHIMNDQFLFSPSIYSLMQRRVKIDLKEMYFDGFFLPNTIIIENSKICNWYFSSEYDPFVLKKGKEFLFPESIMNAFVKGVAPTDIVVKVTYVDLVLNSTTVAKTEYMTPP